MTSKTGTELLPPTTTTSPTEIRAHLIRCFKGAHEHGENLCSLSTGVTINDLKVFYVLRNSELYGRSIAVPEIQT